MKAGKQVLTLDNIFNQEDDSGIQQAGEYLYFKENGRSLVRILFSTIREKIEKEETSAKADQLLDDVKATLAVDDRYYGLNSKGEIRNQNPVGLKLGPDVKIEAASSIVALEDRIVVAWYNQAVKKNIVVLVSRNLDYQYNLAYDAVGSNLNNNSSKPDEVSSQVPNDGYGLHARSQTVICCRHHRYPYEQALHDQVRLGYNPWS